MKQQSKQQKRGNLPKEDCLDSEDAERAVDVLRIFCILYAKRGEWHKTAPSNNDWLEKARQDANAAALKKRDHVAEVATDRMCKDDFKDKWLDYASPCPSGGPLKDTPHKCLCAKWCSVSASHFYSLHSKPKDGERISLMHRNALNSFKMGSLVAKIEEVTNTKIRSSEKRMPRCVGHNTERTSTPIFGWRPKLEACKDNEEDGDDAGPV